MFGLEHSHVLHAGSMGLVCGGLHALGPDHLATLVTFSALMPPLDAAKIGASWGLGHCLGIVLIATVIYALSKIPGVHVEGYESKGDYVIGASMILVAIYFICREDNYITLDEDGEETVKSCPCCSTPPSDHFPSLPQSPSKRSFARESPSPKNKKSFCGSYSEKSSDDEEMNGHGHGHGHGHGESSELVPLIGNDLRGGISGISGISAMDGRDVKSAAVGFLQGMCCPMGLVQITYLYGKSALDTMIFIVVCALVSIIGTATVAALWASLTRSTMSTVVSPRFMYRSSCFLAFACGVLWIIANFFHFLDKVNYAEHHMMA